MEKRNNLHEYLINVDAVKIVIAFCEYYGEKLQEYRESFLFPIWYCLMITGIT